MENSSARALMDITVRGFHFRQSLDVCVSLIARLHSYGKAPAERKDTPIKIRQDLLATNDVVDLALHLRRFAEITNSVSRMKNYQLQTFGWTDEQHFQSQSASLYDVTSRIIHSHTCVACRNLAHVFLHFGDRLPSKEILDGPLGTVSLLVVDSKKERKEFVPIIDFIDAAFGHINIIADKDEEIRKYLERRTF